MSIIRFDIITIFPKVIEAYANESILKRAQKKKLVDIRIHDLRQFSKDKHKKVDGKPYGGGPGMVFFAEPILRAVQKLSRKQKKPLIILTAAGGKRFDAAMAAKLSHEKQIIVVAGHYEGIDERVKKVIHDLGLRVEEISVGPYVLTGGELAAMVIMDAVSRQTPGVLGKEESLEEKRYGVGVPAYTRPETLVWHGKKYLVPKVLLSGDHKKIAAWRKSKSS